MVASHVGAGSYSGEDEGAIPQRSKVEVFPETGSVLVGRPGGVMREKEVLSARKEERDRPERFLRLLGRAGSQKS